MIKNKLNIKKFLPNNQKRKKEKNSFFLTKKKFLPSLLEYLLKLMKSMVFNKVKILNSIRGSSL